MTKLEAITEARSVIAETTVSLSYVTNTELGLWVNEAVKDMSIKGKVYEKSKTLPTSSNVAAYDLPWDYMEPKSLLNVSGSNLILIGSEMIGSCFLVTGKPTNYNVQQISRTPVARQNLTVYTAGTILVSSLSSLSYMYEVTTAGTSGASVPIYAPEIGGRVNDGSCTLTTWEYAPQLYRATLYDTPSLTYAGNFTLTYYAVAQGVAYNDDPLPFLPQWNHVVVKYLCYKWATKAKNTSLAKGFYLDYATSLGLKTEETNDAG